MEGIIFDIQRFSIYDGPGIRTNVFFKGCNLRCLWCHNPESQRREPELMFYASNCVGCGKCAGICDKAFTPECTACGRCAAVCTHGARKISGRLITSDEVVSTVMRDLEYYRTSGGGVTLSGGEPLLQPDFALDILKKCKENGINTAIETAANVDPRVFESVLPFVDTVLCDIKCIDSELHRRLTGVPNTLILQNAEMLKKSGVNIVFRTPVIPGLNDGEVKKIAAFAGGTGLELLAYHKTGCGKYKALGREYSIDDIEPPTTEEMTALAAACGALYSPTGM